MYEGMARGVVVVRRRLGEVVRAVNGRVWEGVRVVKGGVGAVNGGVEGRDGAVYEGMARGVAVVSRRLVGVF